MPKLLYAVDSREYPGKLRLRFVEFTEELVARDDPAVDQRQFQLVDRAHPQVAEFLRSQLSNRAQRRGG
ncbi:MAG: hypothetical protein IT530_16100 [Burkholderiales bacterium]|nr:hypothetical protein [Burkholderiales bacterium]